MKPFLRMTQLHPCPVAPLIGVWSCAPKGYGFDSQSGHITWVLIWSLVGEHTRQKATNWICKDLFLHCQLYSINLHVHSCSLTTLFKNYCSFYSKFQNKKGWVLQLCSFFQNCFGDLGHLSFHINFKITLLISAKTAVRILICWICRSIWKILPS